MMQSGYTAALGMTSQQKRLDTIAHNLANINTVGFKSNRMDFKDALYQTMQRVVQPQEDLNMTRGHGTLVSGVMPDFSQGGIEETNIDTNMYINGNAFFAVQMQQGQIYYTKDGSFLKDVQGNLVTTSGDYVMDVNNQRVRIPTNDFSVSPTGLIQNSETGEVYAQLRVVTFPNKEGLLSVSGNMFDVSDASGQPAQIGQNSGVEIIQGSVERSNVNMADEFARLVRASRVYQFSSRALSMADSMDQKAINVR